MTSLTYTIVGIPGESSSGSEPRGWTLFNVCGDRKFRTMETARAYTAQANKDKAPEDKLIPIEISEEFNLDDPRSKALHDAIVACFQVE